MDRRSGLRASFVVLTTPSVTIIRRMIQRINRITRCRISKSAPLTAPGRLWARSGAPAGRLAAVLLTAIVVFAACAQGPGTAGPRGPSDTAPAFAVTVADQTYTEGAAVSPLTLPAASGGNGTLSYSLAPTVPGLTFTAATRTLGGTPTSAANVRGTDTSAPPSERATGRWKMTLSRRFRQP